LQRGQGYIFEYEDGDKNWAYYLESECEVFGFDIAAWALCLKNGSDNEIMAGISVLFESAWTLITLTRYP